MDDRIIGEGLTFDDVLLVPAWSEVLPREVDIHGRFSRNITLEAPFASAAMDTVTEADMAVAMARAGGIGVIHKNMAPEKQAAEVGRVKAEGLRVAAGVGITPDLTERVARLVEAGVDAVVLDSSHGHSKGVLDALRTVKAAFPGLDVVVGNIATAQAARDLVAAGADGLKVGIGPGSICTTRIVAGVGVPQLTAILEVAGAAGDVPVIATAACATPATSSRPWPPGRTASCAAASSPAQMRPPARKRRSTDSAGNPIGAWVPSMPCRPDRPTATSRKAPKNWCRKAWWPGFPPRGRWPMSYSSSSADSAPAWAIAGLGTWRPCTAPASSASPQPACGKTIRTMLL